MNASFDPGPLADVGCRPAGPGWTLVFVRDLKHPPEKVWAALTEPGQLSQWAPFTSARDLAETGAVTLTMIDGDQSVDMPASVTRAEPPALLEYTWGPDVLRWELAPTALGTRLTLLHTVGERAAVPKMAAGWHLCLRVAEQLLDGRPIPPIRGQIALEYGWEDLNAAYTAKLGAEEESI
ncbi:SRPBCC family protein [Nonomuraea purpurea]|uniref:SRPBCC family protein n=1 Tax=Nonomuraea purpurea TaxID=1849276 RepID=A0ABV8G8T3_9ACTN